MTTTPERAEFEAWFYASKYAQVTIPTAGDVQRAWDAWQAATAVERAEIDRLNRALRSSFNQAMENGAEARRLRDALEAVTDELAAARQSAPESCTKADDCTESLCMQANRCKHTLPPQPQRLCVEQSEDRRDAERMREALNVCSQAIREMDHAYFSPNWFTKGKEGATKQFLMWRLKAIDAIDAALKA